MSELKVYRWASALVPGAVAALVVVLGWVSWCELTALDAELLGATLLLWLIGAYVLGVLAWGIGYGIKCRHLAPFLLHRGDSGWSTRYQGLRLARARKAPGASRLTEERFRQVLYKAIETLSGRVGTRLAGEWEFIGLLQALAFSWVIVAIIGAVALFHPSPGEAVLGGRWGAQFQVALGLGGWITTGLAYRYRVAAFGRDVGYAVEMLNVRSGPVTNRVTIAVDFDGVLADTNSVKSVWLADNHDIELPPYACDHTTCVSVIGKDLYGILAHDVYSAVATAELPAIPGALDGLRRLSEVADLVLLSARQGSELEAAQDWLRERGVLKHFAEILSASETSKLESAVRRGVTMLIDDDVRHLLSPTQVPVQRVRLCPNLRVAHSLDLGIHHVRDWRAVIELVESYGVQGARHNA